jgi:hypothetical protein
MPSPVFEDMCWGPIDEVLLIALPFFIEDPLFIALSLDMLPLDGEAVRPGDWPGLVSTGAFSAPFGAGAGVVVCAQANPAETIKAAEANHNERISLSFCRLSSFDRAAKRGGQVPDQQDFLPFRGIKPSSLRAGLRNGFSKTGSRMLRFFNTVLVVALAVGGVAKADLAPPSCVAAGRAAEQVAALPAGLLVSIGIVESGRVDALTGHIAPWPWTVNADGRGRYLASRAEAVAFVRFAQASGARDIDVGCFQVSLEQHPDAFTDLDQAFDPAVNAAYAAKFLDRLKAETGSWDTAIADYHSAEPDLGLPYQRRVLAAWHGMGDVPAGLGEGVLPMPDPVVILQSAAARRVHVITADGPVATLGMPRVVTP